MDIVSTQSSSDLFTIVIAAYAAVISTFVLGWDAYKWLASGAKINITVSPNMKTFGGPKEDENTYVSLAAYNVGDRPTTIINMGAMYYDSWWTAYIFRRKPKEAFIIATPSEAQKIPYRFEVGDQWIGMALQDGDIEQKAKNGYLFLILYTVGSGQGHRARVTISEQEEGS